MTTTPARPEPDCCGDARRPHVRASERVNGIDDVEVEEHAGRVALLVHLQRSLPPDGELFTARNVRIEGGTVETDLVVEDVEWVRAPDPARDDHAVLRLDRQGDHSRYTVRLVDEEEDDGAPPIPDVDPRYRSASFFFTAGAATDVDCVPAPLPAAPTADAPEISYLAKDYATVRRLLLDRLATTVPGWHETHAADLYLTIVEALAYEADRLSYAQDAVGTEAYLDTARLRTSVRRHVRLVDYPMHEGCNARTWVCLTVDRDPVVDTGALTFLTRPPGVAAGPVLLADDLRGVPRTGYEVFEPLPTGGPARVTAQDVIDPAGLLDRLSGESRDPVLEYVRTALGTDDDAAVPPDPDLDLDRLAARLDALLHEPGLALSAPDAAAVLVERYGSLNALTGRRLAAHNRALLTELFAAELTGPDRLELHEAHNTIRFYTWDLTACRLPAGATGTTLRDDWEDADRTTRRLRHLRPGDVLVLEEVRGPASGDPADADPRRRHPVLLTSVRPVVDRLRDMPVVEITWAAADALPFALVLSARGPAPECALLEDVCVAHGNTVLVDHGETVRAPDPVVLHGSGGQVVAVPFDPPHDVVPTGDVQLCCTRCGLTERHAAHPAPEPVLASAPLVFSEPRPSAQAATTALRQDPRLALPAVAVFTPVTAARPGQDVWVAEAVRYERWSPRRDLVASGPQDRRVVAEVDDAGVAHLRFGDGELGARPEPGVRPLAWYRRGGGTAGNVGDEAVSHVLLDGSIEGGRVTGVRNPLPAVGGTDPEPVDEVRLRAPHAFRTHLQRAVTAEDYATIVERDFPDRVQRAGAHIDVHGGRTRVTVRLDPRAGGVGGLVGGGVAGRADDADLDEEVRRHLERYRRIGHTVEVTRAVHVPLDLAVEIWMLPGHQPGAVRGAVRERLGTRRLADGALAFFHPDALTFGRPVPISAVLAAVDAAPGVTHARVTRLARVGSPDPLPAGDVLLLGDDEIARLDDDADAPEHGTLTVTLVEAP